MSDKRLLYIFTRTPLHVGAGSSVGAIDQPIIRERHTGFPVIPASSLKGSFADVWNDALESEGTKRVRVTADGRRTDAAWLFGSDTDKHAAAGALQFSEARLLAFPIRSAKGSFAWITSPLLLQRAVRDGVFAKTATDKLAEPSDDEAVFDSGVSNKLAIGTQIVLEEYTFKLKGWLGVASLGKAMASLLSDDPIWQQTADRLVILSNGMMSYFARNACEVAQHVAIDDQKGTAKPGALFNQENVPSEAFFYSVLHATPERISKVENGARRTATSALDAFKLKIDQVPVFQFGADASTGLGFCTVSVNPPQGV